MAAAELSLSFDDILDAVRESKRGRWFLEEFESRTRGDDSKSLLTAISKLENVVAGIGKVQGPEAEILARARAAIVAAKKDIATLDRSNLSEEGRLFAKLAAMARDTFAIEEKPTVTNSGVIRALKLVDDLESDICGNNAVVATAPSMTEPSVPAQPPGAFFKQDADVFAPQPVNKKPLPFVVEANTAPEIVEAKGAKLIINRQPSPQVTKETPAQAPVMTPEPGPVEAEKPVAATVPPMPAPAAATAPAIEKPATPRVVIIRRRPEEMTDVPMPGVETKVAETSAA